MLSINELTSKINAIELSTQRHGSLCSYVEVRVRGNYKKGPVPVSVKYTFHFQYEGEWIDESGNTVTAVSGSFETPEERDSYVTNHFSAAK